MRIVHVRSSRGFYGAEALLEGLAREQRARGDEAVVAGLVDEREPHTELLEKLAGGGVGLERVASEGRWAQGVPRRLVEVLRRHRAQVLHVHDYKTTILGGIAAYVAGVPVVCTFHGEVSEGGRVATYQALARGVLRLYEGVATVSREQLGVFEDPWRRCGALFLPNAIDVEGLWREVEERRRRGWRESWRRGLGLPEGALVFGTVARLYEDKAHCAAIDGVAAALEAHPEAVWVLAGDGPERAKIEAEVRRRGLGGRVLLLGFVEDRVGLYAGLDGLLLPSFREGLPMVVLEAMAAGLPVLASPVGEIPGVVTAACGMLLEDRGEGLAKALGVFLADAQRREAWGAAGLARARENYSVQGLARRYEEELYRPAIARARWRVGGEA